MAKIKRSISIEPEIEERIEGYAAKENRSFPAMIETMAKFYDECCEVFKNSESGLHQDKVDYGAKKIKDSTSGNS